MLRVLAIVIWPGQRIQVNGSSFEKVVEVVCVPSSDFSSEFDGSLVVGVSHDVDGEVPEGGHILGAVSFSEAGEVFLEGDIENPMEGIFDLPMSAHGPGGLFGGERSGGDVVAVFPGAEVFVFDAGLDPDQGGDFGKAVFAGQALAFGHPVDGVRAVALVALDVCVEGLWGCVVKEALDLGVERGLVVLDGQEMVGLLVDDVPGDLGIAGNRIDGDQRAGQGPGAGQALQKCRDRGGFVRLVLDRPWPRTSFSPVAKAETRCSAALPATRSWLRREVLPSSAMRSGAAPRSAQAQAMKQAENSSGSMRFIGMLSQRPPGTPW
jgi:hypothetical protein